MGCEPVQVRRFESGGRHGAFDAEIVLMGLHVLHHGLERIPVLDIVGGVDDRIVLRGVVVDDLLVIDDAEPFRGVRQRVVVAVGLIRVGLALVGQQLEGGGVLDRLHVVLPLDEIGVAGDAPHRRGFGLGQLGGQRIVVAVGGREHLDLHARLLGVLIGEILQLVDDLLLVVHEVDLAFVRIGRRRGSAPRHRAHRHDGRGDDRHHFLGFHGSFLSLMNRLVLEMIGAQPLTAPAVTPLMMYFCPHR